MKKIENVIKYFLLFFIIAAFSSHSLYAQNSSKTTIKDAVQSQNFVFVAQTVTPMRGGLRHLTSYYDLSVSKDSVVSDLPYFGRAYTAPLNPEEAGMKFTSTHFNYTATERKNGGWYIVIKPNDNSDVHQVTITIFNNGNASVQINSNNREAISYNGFIKPAKKEQQ